MYQEIKKLAEEALKLQNKNFMDETFKKIIAVCESALAMEAFANAERRRELDERQADTIGRAMADALVREREGSKLAVTARVLNEAMTPVTATSSAIEPSGFRKPMLDVGSGLGDGFEAHGYIPEEPSASYEHVIYGTAKSYGSEAEMIADIQGRPSPVFPLQPEVLRQLTDSELLASAPSGFSADYKHVTYGAVIGEGVGVIGDDGHIVKAGKPAVDEAALGVQDAPCIELTAKEAVIVHSATPVEALPPDDDDKAPSTKRGKKGGAK